MIDERRLQNWGRWLRRGYAPAAAFSAEGEYRAPVDPYALTEARPAEPHEAEAWDIEVACRLLPLQRQKLLALLYVWNLSGPAVIRAYRERYGRRLTLQELDAEEYVAKIELAEHLALPVVIRMARAQQRTRRILDLYHDEPLMLMGD